MTADTPVAGHTQRTGLTPSSPSSPSPPGPIIQVSNAARQLDGRLVVQDLNFEVRQGEIFGFIGPSGSGKTTTIRLLTGVYQPTSGQVLVMGMPPTHPSRRVHERIGYMPQLFVLFPNLTVMENLQFVAGLYGLNPLSRGRRIKHMLQFVEMWDARHRLASRISGGMQRRLQLAAALLHNPPLLFADEPTAGIDPVLRGKFWEEFRRLRDQGRTLFITTQYVSESEYCDRVAVIRRGRIVALDTPLQLRRSAFGGDIVDIESTELSPSAIMTLMQLPVVRHVRPVSRSEARVYVAEAGPAIPVIMDTLSASGCAVNRIEEYRPSFDEVFIELMNRHATDHEEEEDE